MSDSMKTGEATTAYRVATQSFDQFFVPCPSCRQPVDAARVDYCECGAVFNVYNDFDPPLADCSRFLVAEALVKLEMTRHLEERVASLTTLVRLLAMAVFEADK